MEIKTNASEYLHKSHNAGVWTGGLFTSINYRSSMHAQHTVTQFS